MFLSILIPCLIAFIVTYLITPTFIKILKLEGIVGRDQMKPKKPLIPEMGAPPIVFGFIAGIFAYIAAQTFIIKSLDLQQLVSLMAAILTILMIAFIGMLDELTTLMKKKDTGKFKEYKRLGLKKWIQVVLPFSAAFPLMAIAAGVTTITVPFIGSINIGIIYPLVLVPIAIVGATNATNMLAGFNGLQAGLGIVLCSFLGVFAYLQNSYGAALIAFVFVAVLLAFLKYNWYPAKIFPGGLDYVVGAAIASIAIIGNIEKFAVLCFVPWFLELILKARSKFKAESFGVLQKDGTLKAPYKKSYSLLHVIMKLGRFNEWQVSAILISLVAVWCFIISFITYFKVI